jgi:hypothetical protein
VEKGSSWLALSCRGDKAMIAKNPWGHRDLIDQCLTGDGG